MPKGGLHQLDEPRPSRPWGHPSAWRWRQGLLGQGKPNRLRVQGGAAPPWSATSPGLVARPTEKSAGQGHAFTCKPHKTKAPRYFTGHHKAKRIHGYALSRTSKNKGAGILGRSRAIMKKHTAGQSLCRSKSCKHLLSQDSSCILTLPPRAPLLCMFFQTRHDNPNSFQMTPPCFRIAMDLPPPAWIRFFMKRLLSSVLLEENPPTGALFKGDPPPGSATPWPSRLCHGSWASGAGPRCPKLEGHQQGLAGPGQSAFGDRQGQ